mmetsp:Transcript_177139/g.430932  ORF Transcript_177139/g.430932 Transcript_177139/m.430932 type:complete len:385 (+) Transcript_177139:127-1281(+)
MGVCASEEQKKDDSELIRNARKAITVAVVSARNLREREWFPDNKVLLSCTASVPGKEGMVCRTKQMKDSPNPSWLEEFNLKDYEEGDTLEFTIWETIGGRRDVLGKAFLEASTIDPKGFAGEIPLEMADEESSAFLKVKVKLGDEDYPPEPPQEYQVTLTNPKHQTLGIEFDLQDKTTVYVISLKNGLVKDYNAEAEPELAIKSGDFITKANKAEGNATKILEALKTESRLELVLRRPVQKVVAISIAEDEEETLGGPERKKSRGATCTCGPGAEKPAPNKCGMEFGSPAGMSLVITKLTENGPVESWNNNYPEQEVLPGDRVVAVNGDNGKAEDMLRKIQGCERFQMTIVRAAQATDDKLAQTSGGSRSNSKRVNWEQAETTN